jgi:hypothetical protein
MVNFEEKMQMEEMEEALFDMVGLFSADDMLLKGTHLPSALYAARAALQTRRIEAIQRSTKRNKPVTKDTTLLRAAISASNTLHGIYQWVDMIEAEGGAGTISGVAKCHAFLTSLKKNRSRLDSLVMSPLAKELNKTKGTKQ